MLPPFTTVFANVELAMQALGASPAVVVRGAGSGADSGAGQRPTPEPVTPNQLGTYPVGRVALALATVAFVETT